MKRSLLVLSVGLLQLARPAQAADDPFAAGADALAVKAADGSSSLRAKMKLAKLEDDMVMLSVVSLDEGKFPECVFTANVLKEAASTDKHFKLIGRGKSYRFAPVYKMKKKQLDLTDDLTQNNLGACYYPAGTKLIVKVSDVDLKAKIFKAAAIYLK